MRVKIVLITGGAGFVGSHCAKAFAAGWAVITLDNLTRGWVDAVKWGPLIEANIADRTAVEAATGRYLPDVVAHFAAYAYVGESIDKPELYYTNNTAGSLSLLEAMRTKGLKRLLFSSTCATYGQPKFLLIDASHPQCPINPYGWSKFIIKRMLEDFEQAHGIASITLRRFNAAGRDPDGELGERHEPETHAIPSAIAAAPNNESFTVLGTDFDTPDGSAVRDYVHVSDLAHGHVLAAERLLTMEGTEVLNFGTGQGTSVLEVGAAVRQAAGVDFDVEMLVASAERARNLLCWVPTRSSIDSIVESALEWQRTSAQTSRA